MLGENKITDEEIIPLLQSNTLKKLKHLELQNCDLKSGSTMLGLFSQQSNFTSVETLILDDDPIGNEGLTEISRNFGLLNL